MIKSKIILTILLAVVIFTNCTKKEVVEQAGVTTEFHLHSESDEFWYNRLHNIKLLQLNDDQITFINLLLKSIETNKTFVDINLLNISIIHKKLFSETDFYFLFFSKEPLDLYQTDKSILLSSEVVTAALNSLSSEVEFKKSVQKETPSSKKVDEDKPDCNCRWSCGFSTYLNVCDTACEPTLRGCGFLGLNGCNGYESAFC